LNIFQAPVERYITNAPNNFGHKAGWVGIIENERQGMITENLKNSNKHIDGRRGVRRTRSFVFHAAI